MNCKDCKYWKGHKSIQDVSQDMEFSIPIEWNLCNCEQYKASVNMFLSDKKFEKYMADCTVKYFGLDDDGRFRQFPEYVYETSELFGCVFYEKEATE